MKVSELFLLDLLQIVTQLRIGIGVAVAKVDSVVGVLEVILETQSKIIVFKLWVKLDPVLGVVYVAACAHPALLLLPERMLTVGEDSIALIE